MKPKVGLITFSEPRAGVYEARKAIADEETARLMKALGEKLDLVVTEPVRFKPDLLKSVAFLSSQGVESAILHVPIFTVASLVVMAARLLEVPIIVVGNTRPDSHSTVGFLAATGGLDQVGIRHQAILAQAESTTLAHRVWSFCVGASAVAGLRGLTFGIFGGRSLGVTTGTADPAQWMRLFGVDIEHIDQGEIVRHAREIQDREAERHVEWLADRAGKIEYNGGSLSGLTLMNQVKSYLATRKIARDMHLDFMSIQCQTYLSNHFALQCLNCALNNDPYDADGSKTPTVCSCEGDHDGALTMQILKLVSGGKSAALLDVRHIPDAGPITLANCGSLPTWFAARSDTPEENLREVHLIPHVFGEAGGASLQFVCSDGPVTLARLTRTDGRYRMVVVRGRTVKMPRDTLRRTTWAFPHAFLEGEFDRARLLSSLKANHLHMVGGDYADVLKEFCWIAGLDYEVIGEENM